MEQRVMVKGKIPISKEAWDEIWRNAPHVDLRKGPAVAKPIKTRSVPKETAEGLLQPRDSHR